MPPGLPAPASGCHTPPKGGRKPWWASSPPNLRCPVSRVPVSVLEAEPFKFRAVATQSRHTVMADARALALHMIAKPEYKVFGRLCELSDALALDKHLRRLGQDNLHVAEVFDLRRQIASEDALPAARVRAAADLERLTQAADVELKELLRQSEARLAAWLQMQSDGDMQRRDERSSEVSQEPSEATEATQMDGHAEFAAAVAFYAALASMSPAMLASQVSTPASGVWTFSERRFSL